MDFVLESYIEEVIFFFIYSYVMLNLKKKKLEWTFGKPEKSKS